MAPWALARARSAVSVTSKKCVACTHSFTFEKCTERQAVEDSRDIS